MGMSVRRVKQLCRFGADGNDDESFDWNGKEEVEETEGTRLCEKS